MRGFSSIFKRILLTGIFFIPTCAYSQIFTSQNNHTGDWELSSTWSPSWPVPLTTLSGTNITINGFVSANSSVSFTGTSSRLIVNDTLVIKGDLTLGNNNDLTINNNGILIIRGSLIIGNKTRINANGYLICTKDFTKSGSESEGSFTSNDNPEKLFLFGNIDPSSLTDNNSHYSALNCASTTVTKYPNTNCSYGNLNDLMNDPLYQFFQTTCIAPKPEINSNGPLTFCEGSGVTLTSSSGSGYLWSTGATTSSITVSTSGKYTVKITNSAGCLSASSSIADVRVNPTPPTPVITASGSTTICQGGNVTLTSSSGTGNQWSTGSTASSIVVSSTGNYIVKTTDSHGCVSAPSIPKSVRVNDPPVPVITALGPTTFCSGGNVNLSSSEGSSYNWSTGATTRQLNVASSGNYTVRVTDNDGCVSTSSTPVSVTVNPLPVVSAGSDLTIPYGTNTTLNASVSGTGPFTYSWTPSASFVNSAVEDPATVNLNSTASYTFKATSNTTSCFGTDDVTITITGGPLSSSPTASPSTICSGTPVQLHSFAGGGSGTYTYSWTSVPAGFTSSASNPVVNPTGNTIYSVLVNDGFNTITSQVTVNVNPVPAVPVISNSSALVFCYGSSVNLISSAGTNYLWSDGETTGTINVKTSGSYTVKTINASGCSSMSSSPVNVTVNEVPVTPSIAADGPTSICAGGSVNLSSTTENAYLWSNAETSKIVNVKVPGIYSVRVTNDKGCQSDASDPVTIIVNPTPPVPLIIVEGSLTFCQGDSVTLTASPANSYLWSDGTLSQKNIIGSTGTYSVITSNINGCKSNSSQAIPVVVNPLPPVPLISASGPLTFCSGSSVTLTSSASANNHWSDGSTTQSIDVSSDENYYVTIVDKNACESSSAILDVVVNESPVAEAGPDQELNFTFETQMNGLSSGSDIGIWSLISGAGNFSDPNSPTSKLISLGVGENIFLWTVKNEFCESADEIKITVINQFVPNVITPNGDGKNDYFRISEYPGKAKLIIINRWGNEEFSSEDYQNDWDGRNSKGNEMPPDTYFYILNFDNGKTLKGSVLIKR